MMKVEDCKLRKILECSLEDSVINVAKKLKDSRERHIIVTDKGNPKGIISTTDINNRVVAEGKDPKKTKAKEIMTATIKIIDIEEPIGKVYFDMVKSNIFSCPVVKNKKLQGVLDLKEALNIIVNNKIKL
jgi:CBS domain-containing protein